MDIQVRLSRIFSLILLELCDAAKYRCTDFSLDIAHQISQHGQKTRVPGLTDYPNGCSAELLLGVFEHPQDERDRSGLSELVQPIDGVARRAVVRVCRSGPQDLPGSFRIHAP